jgi:hypothetical protein
MNRLDIVSSHDCPSTLGSQHRWQWKASLCREGRCCSPSHLRCALRSISEVKTCRSGIGLCSDEGEQGCGGLIRLILPVSWWHNTKRKMINVWAQERDFRSLAESMAAADLATANSPLRNAAPSSYTIFIGNRSNHFYIAYTKIWTVVLQKFIAFYLKSIIPCHFRHLDLPLAVPPLIHPVKICFKVGVGLSGRSQPTSSTSSLLILSLSPASASPSSFSNCACRRVRTPGASSPSPVIPEMVYAASPCFFYPS